MLTTSLLLAACAPAPLACPQDLETLVGSPGPLGGQVSGTVLCSAGDWDSDGVGDYAVGFPDEDVVQASAPTLTDLGRVRVYSGATGDELGDYLDLSQVTLSGASLEPRLGAALAGPFDTDGDGRPEIAVGLPGVEKLQFLEPGLLAGSIVRVSTVSAPIDFTGQFTWDEFGSVLENLGDVNGDGRADLGVGAPASSRSNVFSFLPNVGAARIVSGDAGSTLVTYLGTQAGARLGAALCGLADSSGDGLRDVAIGSPGENRVRVYAPFDPTQPASQPKHVIDPPASTSPFFVIGGFGSALADLGDLDGGSRGELAVQADESTLLFPTNLLAGFSLDGPLPQTLWTLELQSQEDGRRIAAADVDGDGRRELLYSRGRVDANPFLISNSGTDRVVAIDGETTAQVAAWPAPTTAAGGDLTELADLDGDGGAEFAVGLPELEAPGASRQGGVVVHGLDLGGGTAPPRLFEVSSATDADFASLGIAALVAPPGSTLRVRSGPWGTVFAGHALAISGDPAFLLAPEIGPLSIVSGGDVTVTRLRAAQVEVFGSTGRITLADLEVAPGGVEIGGCADVALLGCRIAPLDEELGDGTVPAVLVQQSAVQLVACDVEGSPGPGFSDDGGDGVLGQADSRLFLFGTDVRGGAGAAGFQPFGAVGGAGGDAVAVASGSTALIRGNASTVIDGGPRGAYAPGQTDGLDLSGDPLAGELLTISAVIPIDSSFGIAPVPGSPPYVLQPGYARFGGSLPADVRAGAGVSVALVLTLAPAATDLPQVVESVPLWVDTAFDLSTNVVVGAGLGVPQVFAYGVPPEPALIGLAVHLQGFVPLAGGTFEGTNGNAILITP